MEMLELDVIQFRELKSHLKLLPLLKVQVASLKEEKESLISLVHKLRNQLSVCRCPKVTTDKGHISKNAQQELGAIDDEVRTKLKKYEYVDDKPQDSLRSRSSTEGDDDQHCEMCDDSSFLLADDLSSKLSFVESLSSQTSAQSSADCNSSIDSPSSMASNSFPKNPEKCLGKSCGKEGRPDWVELFGITRTLCDIAVQTEENVFEKTLFRENHTLYEEEILKGGDGVEWSDYQGYLVKSRPTKCVETMTCSPTMRSIGISAVLPPTKGAKDSSNSSKVGSASPKLSARTVKLKSINSMCSSKSADSIHSNVIETTSNGSDKNVVAKFQDSSSQTEENACLETYQCSTCHKLSSAGLLPLLQSPGVEPNKNSEDLKCLDPQESETNSSGLYTFKIWSPKTLSDTVLLHLRSMQIKMRANPSIDIPQSVLTEWLDLVKNPEVTSEDIGGFLKSVSDFAGSDVCQLIVQLKDEHDNSALHYLTGRNNFRAVQVLLSTNWVNCDEVNRAGFSVAQMAAVSCPEKKEDLAVLRFLFSKSNVHQIQPKSGRSLLMMACTEENVEIAGILCEVGADVNNQDNQGFTALMLAVENGSESLTKLLLRKANCDVSLCNADGENAVVIALNLGYKHLALQIYSRNLHKSPTS